MKDLEEDLLALGADGRSGKRYAMKEEEADPLRKERESLKRRIAELEEICSREISKREAIEKELEKYRLFSDNANDSHFLVNRNAEILYANKVACDKLGFSLDELLEKTVQDVDVVFDLTKYQELFDQVQGEKVPHFESVNKKRDGTLFTSEFSVIGVRIQDEPYLFAVARDISERKKMEEALQREKEFSEKMINAVNDTIFVFDPERRTPVKWNKAFRDISGYSDEEIARIKAPDGWYDEADLQSVGEAMEKIFRGEHSIVEMSLINKKGERIPTEYTGSMIKDVEDQPQYLIAVGRDVRDRKSIEEKILLQSEIMTNMAEGTSLIRSDDGIIVYANPKFEKMFGYEPGEMLGKHVSAINAPTQQSPKETAQEISAILKDRGVWSGEVYNIKKDGTPFWCHANVSTFSHPRYGDVWISVHNDITERKKSEKALQESEQSLKKAQKIAKLGSWKWDIAKDELFWSEEMYSIFKVKKGTKVRNELVTEKIHPQDLPLFHKAMTELNSGNPPPYIEYRIVDEGGEIRYIHSEIEKKEILYGESGKPVFMMGIVQDVTEQKKAEEFKKNLEKKILHAQKLESLEVLAGGIAHDFNNLLMGVLGNVELAIEKLSPLSPIGNFLDSIESSAKKAAELSQQMLAYSGRGRFVIDPIDLNGLLKEMAHMIETSVPREITLRFNFGKNLPCTRADIIQLRQVIMNLVTNASEAIGEESGIISITTGSQICDRYCLSETVLGETYEGGLYVFLEVVDTGEGMDRATREKIFDPFFTTKFTGRGLGLAALLGIVRGHRGAIKIDSEPGKGTVFRILLPAMEKPVFPEKEHRRKTDFIEGKGMVLLVDDMEEVRSVGSRMLKSIGFSVVSAVDGEEALHIFEEKCEEIKVIVLDLSMPRMGGEECFGKLREIREETPIIIASGYSEEEVADLFKGKGADGFIQKPFSVNDLKEKLQSVFNKEE